MTTVYSTTFDPATGTAKLAVGEKHGWAISPTPPYNPPPPDLGGMPVFMSNDQMNMTVAGMGSVEATLSFTSLTPANKHHTPFAEYNHAHRSDSYPYMLGDYLVFDHPHPKGSQWSFTLTVADASGKASNSSGTLVFDPELQVGPGTE